jgi:hypothetical protein
MHHWHSHLMVPTVTGTRDHDSVLTMAEFSVRTARPYASLNIRHIPGL